jgi:membrane peptidoglycan carboxypeptidase
VQAFSTDVADTVNYALQKVVTDGTGKAAQKLGRPVAGKTGTTNDNKSALFSGYTQEIAATVMFTKDGPDGKPITLSGTGGMTTVTGGSFPARIFTAFMKGALKDIPVSKFAPLPSGQPNGAKPTASPSASALPSSNPTPMPTDTTSSGDVLTTVPDISSSAWITKSGGTYAAARKEALKYGLAIAYTTQVGNLDLANAWVVVDSQDLVAGSDAFLGDTVTIELTNIRP